MTPAKRILAVWIIVAAAVVQIQTSPERTLAAEAAAAPADVAALRAERVVVLKEALQQANEYYRAGTSVFDDVRRCQLALAAAQMEAAATSAERIAVLKAAILYAREMEREMQGRLKAGVGRALDVSEAKACRLRLEIDLALERTSAPAKP